VALTITVVSEFIDLLILVPSLICRILGSRTFTSAKIGRVSPGKYLLLSKDFPAVDSKGNHSLVSQNFSGGNLEDFLRSQPKGNSVSVCKQATETGPQLVD